MPPVPILPPSDVIKTFQRLGWQVVRQKGSQGNRGQSAISEFCWRRRRVDDRDGCARSPNVEIAL